MNTLQLSPMRTTLEELDHLQPTTPLRTVNSTADGIMNKIIKQRQSKVMDKRLYYDLTTQEIKVSHNTPVYDPLVSLLGSTRLPTLDTFLMKYFFLSTFFLYILAIRIQYHCNLSHQQHSCYSLSEWLRYSNSNQRLPCFVSLSPAQHYQKIHSRYSTHG